MYMNKIIPYLVTFILSSSSCFIVLIKSLDFAKHINSFCIMLSISDQPASVVITCWGSFKCTRINNAKGKLVNLNLSCKLWPCRLAIYTYKHARVKRFQEITISIVKAKVFYLESFAIYFITLIYESTKCTAQLEPHW